jgi:cytosine/adenosine deaminase-related metal-dependent hydrolase
MPASIIRARTIFTEPADRRRWHQLDDGAVLQHDGVIAEIGRFPELIAKHPQVPVLGTGRQVLLPGFVNAHHHVGLTPVQLGSPDMPLELWFVTRLVARRVDLYLDTLYSAFEMIASGITTVQHLHGWLPGDLAAVEAGAGEVIRAYQDIGMRVSYSFALRDQSRLVYHDDRQFIVGLPAELRPLLERHFARFPLTSADYGALFEELRAKHHAKERVKIQLAPAISTGARTPPSKCSPISRRATRRRCTCTSSRPPIRRNMPAGAAAARHSTISTASVFSGRF